MRPRRLIVLAALTAGTVAPVGVASATAVPNAVETGVVDICGPVPAGYARCLAETASRGGVVGLTPAQIKAAYGFPTGSTVGAGQTVAIVTAFDAPTIEADLKKFSNRFHLPACTTANGCFTKLDDTGGTSYPPVDAGWALEASLDVEWVHAIAPGAKIVLVEATSNLFGDLFSAVDLAKTKGAYVSNSWGAVQFSLQSIFEPIFTLTPGVSFFFGSGDEGAPGIYPAASPNVISVGGTKLRFHNGQFRKETGWAGSGGGCNAFQAASAAQAAFAGYAQVNCAGMRAFPDVSLNADPRSGVAVYDSTPIAGQSGWFSVGGTSASTPMVAARAAALGAVVDQSFIYGNSVTFRDITKGNNGLPARAGYDLVTGRGSWTG